MAGKGGLAEEIRAGLDPVTVESPQAKVDLLDEIWFRKPVRQHIREFAQVFALVFLLIAGISAYKNGPNVLSNSFIALSLVTLALGYKTPRVLHPLWKGWMAIGHYLGAVMSIVILSIAWAILVIPIAIILKVMRIKVMDLSFGAKVDSYWEKRDPKFDDFALLKRQF